MKVVITAIAENEDNADLTCAVKTFREAMKIAKKVGGKIVYGRGFDCGTEIVLEK